VRQIILNLVSNAIKYTERGAITVRAHPQNSEVVVSIRDTGIGINPQDLPTVFEPFRQVGRPVGRRTTGTGLGLAITRRFVEMHGGRIWVESEPGQGSTFFFTLPAMASSRTGANQEDTVPEVSPSSRTVLVVDNDPDTISLFRGYLEKRGYQVIGAQDAVEALRLAWEEHPYAITLEVGMPEEAGWTVLRALKEDEATRQIPVVVCSTSRDERTCFGLGAADYLLKPVGQEDLLASLSNSHRPARQVVVIHNDPLVLSSLSSMLEGTGLYQVTQATTGEEGLAAVQQRPPDLTILGLHLSGLDGFEVLSRLKSGTHDRGIPTIGVTAQDLTAEEEVRLQGQVDVLLHQGAFRAEDLLADVARVLRRS
jgi:CheY-like chemotaxis protein